MDGVCEFHWIVAVCDVENLAFLRVELHQPLLLPFLERFQILLKLGSIICVVDHTIHHTVICE